MKDVCSIQYDSKLYKITQKAISFLLAVASIAFCYGLIASAIGNANREKANQERILRESSIEAAENMSVSITGKENKNAYASILKFDFSVVIKNNNDTAVNYIEGILEIKDADGNILSQGTAYFGTDMMNTTKLGYAFHENSEETYTLTWEDDLTDGTREIWDSEYTDLTFSFEITRIRLENNNVVDLKPEP